MQHLFSHDDEAQRIADKGVQIFRERYLSPAAEVCYWRRLIREWKKVISFKPEFFKMVGWEEGMERHFRGEFLVDGRGGV